MNRALLEELRSLPELALAPKPSTRTIGWTVYSRSIHDADDFPIGGVVVELIEGHDPEGELYRKYLTAQRHRGELSLQVIDESDVGEAMRPNSLFVVDVIRALLQEVAMAGCKPRTGAELAVEHRSLIAYAMHLVSVL